MPHPPNIFDSAGGDPPRMVDRLLFRPGAFWMRITPLGAQAREFARWFEDRAPELVGPYEETLSLGLTADGGLRLPPTWPDVDRDTLGRWSALWALLASLGIRRLELVRRLESNQLVDVLVLLFAHRRAIRRQRGLGATLSDRGVQYACARTCLRDGVLRVEYSYCETRFTKAVDWFQRRRGDFGDHRALFRAAPRYAALVALVALVPFALYLFDANRWLLLGATIVGISALFAMTYLFFMTVGSIEYDNEEKAYRLARAYEQLKHHSDKTQDDLNRARLVQENLLPDMDNLPLAEHVTFAASFAPEADVGGDYFDIAALGESKLALAFADVSGHGLAAALITAIIKTTFHAWTERGGSLEELILSLNDQLTALTADDSFAAVFLATYDAPTRCLRYSNCGHSPLPRVVSTDGGAVRELDAAPGMVLGVLADMPVAVAEYTLSPGDALVLCTDGIVECHGSDNKEMFGFDRLNAFLRRRRSTRPQDLVAGLVEAVNRFTGQAEQIDDQTVLVMQVRDGSAS